MAVLFQVGCANEPRQPPLEYSQAELIWTAGGHNDDGGLVLSDLQSGAIASDGLILVAESGRLAGSQSGLVHLLSHDGQLLATIGRRGRGPGEYESIGSVGFGRDSLVWATDPVLGRINWFSRSGAFIRADSRPRERVRDSQWYLYPHASMPDGAVLGSAAGVDDADSIPVAMWLAGGHMARLSSAPLHSPRSLKVASGVVSQMLSANPIVAAASGSDWFFVLDRKPAEGRTGVIGIDRYDSAGRRLGHTAIQYDARDVDVTVTEWLEGWARAYAEALPGVRATEVYAAMWIPSRLPPVQQAIADARGFWLRRERTSEGLWQRYDLAGKLLVNVTLPEPLQALAADDSTIVGWERDSLLTPLVRKFRIRPDRAVEDRAELRSMIIHEVASLAWEFADEIVDGALLTDSSAHIRTSSGDVYEALFTNGSVRRSSVELLLESSESSRACRDQHVHDTAVYADIMLAVRRTPTGRFQVTAHRMTKHGCGEGRTVDLDCATGSLSVALASATEGIAACSLGEIYLLEVDAKLRIDAIATSQRESFASGAAGLWYGLPILRLDTGYLRVFADLRSDRRRLEWLNHHGVLDLIMELDDPIGFVAADSRSRRLLGLRDGKPGTIAIYEWRWK